MLLFPYYRHGGPDEAFARTQEVMDQRSRSAEQIEDLLAEEQKLESKLEQQDESNRGVEQRISQLKIQLADINSQLAKTPVLIAEPVDMVTPQVQPRAVTHGVEFSILGLAAKAKSFVIVIDMSGSMASYEDLMLETVREILEPLNESNQFAIIGYQGNPLPRLWVFPGGTTPTLAKATSENLRNARLFTESLANRFVGSTPTHFALQAALEFPPSAIILMSDGEPNTQPGFIIQDITGLNQVRQTEIHTVAIGDYTHNRNLVLFLQTLSRLNNGDFVGVSR